MLGSLGEVLFSPIIANKGCWDWTEAWAHLPIPEVAETLCPFGVEPHNPSAVRC